MPLAQKYYGNFLNSHEVIMKSIGMRVLIQRDKDGEFDLRIPTWIGERLGDLLLMEYDGWKLTIYPAEIEPMHSCRATRILQ
jgi:hypothetical protein